MMTGRLFVHSLSMERGTMTAALGDATGRHLCLEMDPNDYPALQDAYDRLCEAIIAGASTVMLDLLDLAGAEPEIPDAPEEPAVSIVPCRICGADVTIPYPPQPTSIMGARCGEHTTR